jgi:hypothetical protein
MSGICSSPTLLGYDDASTRPAPLEIRLHRKRVSEIMADVPGPLPPRKSASIAGRIKFQVVDAVAQP